MLHVTTDFKNCTYRPTRT